MAQPNKNAMAQRRSPVGNGLVDFLRRASASVDDPNANPYLRQFGSLIGLGDLGVGVANSLVAQPVAGWNGMLAASQGRDAVGMIDATMERLQAPLRTQAGESTARALGLLGASVNTAVPEDVKDTWYRASAGAPALAAGANALASLYSPSKFGGRALFRDLGAVGDMTLIRTRRGQNISPERVAQLETEAPEAMALLRQYGTDNEARMLTEDGVKKLNALLSNPKIKDSGLNAEDLAALALAGRSKRGWYKHSAEAIAQTFGEDAPRFAALLAATSPQTSVESNLLNTVTVWKNWVAAGRPQDAATIKKIMGASVQGNKGEESVLDAWFGNSVRALTAENPVDAMLSGPKVDSFRRNLLGFFDEVTNDTWQARAVGLEQAMFGGAKNKTFGDVGIKSPEYIGANLRTREAAKLLSERTGSEWTPAEVQETVWSAVKTLWESRAREGELRSMSDLLREGAVTDEMISGTPDFATLLKDPTYAGHLREVGLGEKIDTLTPWTGQREAGTLSGAGIERNADRLEKRYRYESLPGALNPIRRSAFEASDPAGAVLGRSGPFARGGLVLGRDNLDGAAARSYTLNDKDAAQLGSLGVSTPGLLELSPSPGSGQQFHSAIIAAKEAEPTNGAAVYAYSPEDYAGMRTFLTEDGKAGFALKGDEVVSVFNTRGGPHPNVSPTLLMMAIQKGARKLDAFDTVLPSLYSVAGFKQTARNAFSDKYAPQGWNFNALSDFNQGRPDVVHMAYDPSTDNPRLPIGPPKYGRSPTRENLLTPSYERAAKRNAREADRASSKQVADLRKRADKQMREIAAKRGYTDQSTQGLVETFEDNRAAVGERMLRR